MSEGVGVLAGDHGAFEEFVVTMEPRLLRAFVGSRGMTGAADAAAEALAFAFEHWDRVRRMENPGGYLYRVGQSRTRPRRPPELPAPVDVGLPDVEPDLVPALLALPETQRTAVWLVQPADVVPAGRLHPGPSGTMLAFGSTDGDSNVLTIVDPRRAIDGPDQIQIGFSTLTLGRADSLGGMSSPRVEGSLVVPTIATIATPEGDCTVTHEGVPSEPPTVACPLPGTAERLNAQLRHSPS